MAFNLILLDTDGIVKNKIIRGFDRSSAEYACNLSNLIINSSYYDRLRIADMLRSPNLITIKNGTLVENPVIDKCAVNTWINSSSQSLFDDIGCIYSTIDYGGMIHNLYEVGHTIVLNGRDLSFSYAPYFNSEMIGEDIYSERNLEPIDELLKELEREVNLEGDTIGVELEQEPMVEPAPVGLTGKDLENFYRKQFMEQQKMDDEMYNDTEPFFEED